MLQNWKVAYLVEGKVLILPLAMENNGESSAAGARRMRQLALSDPYLPGSSTVAIHHPTGQILYPAASASGYQGYLAASLLKATPPRAVPLPSVVSAPTQLSISPDGDWLVFFHPGLSSTGAHVGGGTLAIYPSSILLPTTTANTAVPLASFPLQDTPLSTLHLYPPRLHLPDNKLGPALGPLPPLGYSPSHGPTFLVLLPNAVLLFHPQKISGGQPQQPSSQQQPLGTESWSMNFLRGALQTRFYATFGGAVPADTGLRADRGWSGLVPGDHGAWTGWEAKGKTGILRIEVGKNREGAMYMRTLPMPALPLMKAPRWDVPVDDQTATGPADDVESRLQGILFARLPEQRRKTETDGSPSAEQEPPALDGVLGDGDTVGATLVYRDCRLGAEAQTGHLQSRTRLETMAFQRRKVELPAGFLELGSSETPPSTSYDWVTSSNPARTIISPPDVVLSNLYPLPSVGRGTATIGTMQTPDGPKLISLDVLGSTGKADGDAASGTAAAWTAATEGPPAPLPAGLWNNPVLAISQSVERGCMGLVGAWAPDEAMYFVDASVEPGETDAPPDTSSAYRAAIAIAATAAQGDSYSDVVLAYIGSIPPASQAAGAEELLDKSFETVRDTLGLDEVDEMLRLQVAVFGAIDDPRRDVAVQLLRLRDASHLFSACAQLTEGRVTRFDLDAIWPLLHVTAWALTTLAQIFRQGITAHARLEWDGDSALQNDGPTALIGLVHPMLRRIPLLLLSQIYTFSQFILGLEEPIPTPDTLATRTAAGLMPGLASIANERDPRATILAQDRVRELGLAVGVDTRLWGRGLEQLNIKTSISRDNLIRSFLHLDMDLISELVAPTLAALPSDPALFLALPSAEMLTTSYDAITFRPLPVLGSRGRGSDAYRQVALGRCERCLCGTVAIGPGAQSSLAGITPAEERGWKEWVRAGEERCPCGGAWVKW